MVVVVPQEVMKQLVALDFTARYKLQVTSDKLKSTSYKLQVTIWKLQVISYKLPRRICSSQRSNKTVSGFRLYCKVQVTSYKLQVTSYKLQVTS